MLSLQLFGKRYPQKEKLSSFQLHFIELDQLELNYAKMARQSHIVQRKIV